MRVLSFQENYKTLQHSRVWPIKNVSAIWCCLVENMKELYRKTPDNSRHRTQ